MKMSEAGRLGYEKSKEKLLSRSEKMREDAIIRWSGIACARCGEPITYEKRANIYCSRKCAAIVNNTARSVSGNITRKDARPSQACEGCDKTILHPKKEQVFCSQRCAQESARKRITELWLSGKHTGGTWSGVCEFVRIWLIARFGNRCVKCGWHEVNVTSGKVPIQVEHIDGNPYNHRPENLTLLCPNCHSLTPTFGGLNRGSGRAERYQRRRGSLGGVPSR
jgi:predicted nucleic acid-binding Zn ribbon protein